MHKPNDKDYGFTIVELLVVIVVIGILAAITIVAYTGIQQKAIIASLQSDLTNGSNQLKMYQVTDSSGNYPTAVKCPAVLSTDICLKSSGSNSFTGGYTANNNSSPKTFSLDVYNGTTRYRITNDSAPIAMVGITCPTGFIAVPGSATYSTSDFCVMKYEAKQVGATTTPISQASGLPWVSITQTDAIANSPNVAGCAGCHLITEAEWLTIAQNVLNMPSNWSTGVVGSGYIYSGHNDAAPANALVADSSDSNNYAGETNTGGNQRRTLNLSNGEVIWDFAGNVFEWTNATIAGGQQPGFSGEVGYAWKQWNNVSLIQNGLPAATTPVYTGISGISGWDFAQGIGQLESNYGESIVKGYLRGGNWNAGTGAGVLALVLYEGPAQSGAQFGFRVSK